MSNFNETRAFANLCQKPSQKRASYNFNNSPTQSEAADYANPDVLSVRKVVFNESRVLSHTS